MRDVARIGIATLVVAANFAIQRIGDDDNLALTLYVVISLFAGLIIGRWWALCIALGWIAVSLTVSPGPEDSRFGAIVLIGVIPGAGQAALLGIGVLLAKVVVGIRRR